MHGCGIQLQSVKDLQFERRTPGVRRFYASDCGWMPFAKHLYSYWGLGLRVRNRVQGLGLLGLTVHSTIGLGLRVHHRVSGLGLRVCNRAWLCHS